MINLRIYMRWLRDQGGTIRTGIGADHSRVMVPVTRLQSPDGQSYVYPGADQFEVLSPLQVEIINRRLGVKYPR